MTDRKTVITTIIAHSIFWGIITCFFLTHSFLRAFPLGEEYKELLSVGLIMMMVYFNYLFLFPRYFQTGKLAKYLLLSILAIAIADFSEFLLLRGNIYGSFPASLDAKILNYCVRMNVILMGIRDFCFFLFFFMLRLYLGISKEYLLEKKALAQKENFILIKPTQGEIQEIEISDLIYVSQSGNSTFFHLFDGVIYEQYSSLKRVEEFLPAKSFLRINRSTTIILPQVIEFDDNCVKMGAYENGKEKVLEISSRYKENALVRLRQNEMRQKTKNVLINNGNVLINMTKNEAVSEENREEMEENSRKLMRDKILVYIVRHPGCNTQDIIDHVKRTNRTISRYLRELKEQGQVEFRGANKTGGYHAINPKHKG